MSLSKYLDLTKRTTCLSPLQSHGLSSHHLSSAGLSHLDFSILQHVVHSIICPGQQYKNRPASLQNFQGLQPRPFSFSMAYEPIWCLVNSSCVYFCIVAFTSARECVFVFLYGFFCTRGVLGARVGLRALGYSKSVMAGSWQHCWAIPVFKNKSYHHKVWCIQTTLKRSGTVETLEQCLKFLYPKATTHFLILDLITLNLLKWEKGIWNHDFFSVFIRLTRTRTCQWNPSNSLGDVILTDGD